MSAHWRRRRPGECTHVGPVHALTYARLYPNGWWCARHTSLALRGIQEDLPGSGIPAAPLPRPSHDSHAAVDHRTDLNL